MDRDWERSGPWIESRRGGWIYRAMVGLDANPSGFIDVHAFSPNGDHLVGTLGTVSAVEERLQHYQGSGECLGGAYFWSSGLVLVESGDPAVLLRVLDDLASAGELHSAFQHATSDG